jgi:hypothetical protein
VAMRPRLSSSVPLSRCGMLSNTARYRGRQAREQQGRRGVTGPVSPAAPSTPRDGAQERASTRSGAPAAARPFRAAPAPSVDDRLSSCP